MTVLAGRCHWLNDLLMHSVVSGSYQHHFHSVRLEHLHVELCRHGLEPVGITKGMGITKKCNICQGGDHVALISD